MKTKNIQARLEYLRGELRAERISQDELLELESLAKFIAPGDVELLEAAGVPEESNRFGVPAQTMNTVKGKVGKPLKLTGNMVALDVENAGQPGTQTDEKPFDTVGFIMDFESGNVSNEELISGFQHLIDSGTAWSLQGSYGRTASALIEQGLCTR